MNGGPFYKRPATNRRANRVEMLQRRGNRHLIRSSVFIHVGSTEPSQRWIALSSDVPLFCRFFLRFFDIALRRNVIFGNDV